MPVPAAILGMGVSAHNCGNIQRVFANPRGGAGGRVNLTRTFHVYLELTMQAKHDQLIAGYCHTVGAVARRQDGTQVRHPPRTTAVAALAGFYVLKAGVAADVTVANMTGRWQRQAVGGAPVFTPGVRVDAGVQNQVQNDRYQYEISYWYDGDDIYVLYHCYPDR